MRIAQRAVDLLTLPHGLNEIPAVLQVAHFYLLYLEKFQDCLVPTDAESENSFTDMLQRMILGRSSIPNAIARGVDEWMRENNNNFKIRGASQSADLHPREENPPHRVVAQDAMGWGSSPSTLAGACDLKIRRPLAGEGLRNSPPQKGGRALPQDCTTK